METENQSRRTIWIFATASFLNDTGHYLITVIWPIFLTSVLGASTTFLGLVDGLGDSLASISQAVSGVISDRTKKRKIFIWIGYLGAALGRVIYFFSQTPWQFIPGKILDRGGKMRDAPRDAIVADIKKHGSRATAFGALRAADRIGAFAGLMASMVLIGYFTYRQLFLIAAIPSFIGSLLIVFLIRDTRDGAGRRTVSLSLKSAGRDLRLLTIASLIFTLGAFSDSFYILAAKSGGFSVELVTLLYAVFLITAALSAIPFGKLADKKNRRVVIMISYFFFMITNFFFIAFNSFIGLLFAFLFYGLFYGAYRGNIKTLVADLSPRDVRASLIGTFGMLTGLVALPASLIAGFLWQAVDLKAPFVLAVFLSLISLLVISLVREGEEQRAENENGGGRDRRRHAVETNGVEHEELQ